jgi:hypothetical protein
MKEIIKTHQKEKAIIQLKNKEIEKMMKNKEKEINNLTSLN